MPAPIGFDGNSGSRPIRDALYPRILRLLRILSHLGHQSGASESRRCRPSNSTLLMTMEHERPIVGYRLSFSLLDGLVLGIGFWLPAAAATAVVWFIRVRC